MDSDKRLKGFGSISRTVNLGRFNSIRIELSKEFFLEDGTHEAVLDELDMKIRAWVKKAGLTERYD
jgi:hypothetical protein